MNGNEPLDMDLDIFDDLDINIDPNIALDTETVLEPPSTVGLSFAHINVNGIDAEGRMDKLKYLFKNKPFDLISINETKLTNNMPDKDFELDSYTLVRAECKQLGKKLGGGCALYFRDNITSFVEKT